MTAMISPMRAQDLSISAMASLTCRMVSSPWSASFLAAAAAPLAEPKPFAVLATAVVIWPSAASASSRAAACFPARSAKWFEALATCRAPRQTLSAEEPIVLNASASRSTAELKWTFSLRNGSGMSSTIRNVKSFSASFAKAAARRSIALPCSLAARSRSADAFAQAASSSSRQAATSLSMSRKTALTREASAAPTAIAASAAP